jgi:hypothetical protein
MSSGPATVTAPDDNRLRVGAAVRPALDLIDQLHPVVRDLDPAQLPARDAVDMVRVLDRLVRVAEAGKALAAARVAESSLWTRGGHRSPAHWVAAETGVRVGDAADLLHTAETLAGAPRTREALTDGRLSRRQAAAVGDLEKVAPDDARDLMARAGRLSVGELETESRRLVNAHTHENDGARIARHRRTRSLRTGTDPDGMGWGHWKLPPAEHARLVARLEALQGRVFVEARRRGDREPTHALAADALCRLAERRPEEGESTGPARDAEITDDDPSFVRQSLRPAGATTRTRPRRGARRSESGSTTEEIRSRMEPSTEDWSFAKVIVRVDASALHRGSVAPGEVCEIAGHGPIAVGDAWRVVAGGALVALLDERGTAVDRIVHLGRRPTALQRTAIEWTTGGTCAIEGCSSTARYEIDHVAEWATTSRTELRHLAGVCGHHHDLKTHGGYRFSDALPSGKRRLLPPGAGPPPADLALDPIPRHRRDGPGIDTLFDTG